MNAQVSQDTVQSTDEQPRVNAFDRPTDGQAVRASIASVTVSEAPTQDAQEQVSA